MCFEGGWVGARLVIPAEAGIHFRLVIPANAGIQFVFALRRFAITDSRPCAAWSPSMATRYFLLLVQEKVTKENTPSERRPREGHAADPSALPRGFRGVGRAWAWEGEPACPHPALSRKRERGKAFRICGRDCRALPFTGPFRSRRAGGGSVAKRSPAGSRQVCCSTRTYCQQTPQPAREVRGQDARAPRPRGCPFLFGDLLLDKQKKVTRPLGTADEKTHGRRSAIATTRTQTEP